MSVIAPAMFRVELLRQVRNPYTLVFTLGLPVAMYMLFGATAEWAASSVGDANVAFYVMVSMGAYGTATAMSSMCSLAASEVAQGWGRQLALTPMRMTTYAGTKLGAAALYSVLAVALVYLAGALTGAEADDPWRWAVAAVLTIVVGTMFGLWGMGVGLLFTSDSAAALASIAITFFGFFGNAFLPMSGIMLDIAHYTPMYGYVALVRWPATDGALVDGGSDPLWAVMLNIVAWTIVFAGLVRVGIVRSRRRR
ncbi:ABC transporter permease [Microbacterium sp.]|uniref:ABC transporter permease n=1 Tax=Microbacterium sp. TaxID=51671 RepID=UPI003A8A6693